jgi:hypothetical protein
LGGNVWQYDGPGPPGTGACLMGEPLTLHALSPCLTVLRGQAHLGTADTRRLSVRHLPLHDGMTGDMLREQVAKKPLGVEAKKTFDAGGLISSDIIAGVTGDQLETNRLLALMR